MNNLPKDIILKIFNLLLFKDSIRLSQVNKIYYQIFNKKNIKKSYLEKWDNYVFNKDIIGTYHGKWYEVQRHMVCDSDYLDKLKIETNMLLKFQSKVFQSHKVINFYMMLYSSEDYAKSTGFLRFLENLGRIDEGSG